MGLAARLLPEAASLDSHSSHSLFSITVFTFIIPTINAIVPFILCTFHCALSIWTHRLSSSAERQVFLATWKDIPNENESQFEIKDCHLNSGEKKLRR